MLLAGDAFDYHTHGKGALRTLLLASFATAGVSSQPSAAVLQPGALFLGCSWHCNWWLSPLRLLLHRPDLRVLGCVFTHHIGNALLLRPRFHIKLC